MLPCELGESCMEAVFGGIKSYVFQGSRPGPSSSTLVGSSTDLEGIYRKYSESSTTYYDYYIVSTIFDPLKGLIISDSEATYSRTTRDTYTTFQPHTQDSLNEYTEDYRETRTGPMPEERVIKRETIVEESVWSETDGGWVELVRPPVAGGSAGSQVVTQVIAQALGEPYVVQSGDSLWAIAERIYGDGSRWQDIAGANPQLQNPNAIYAGQALYLPEAPTTSLPTLTDGYCIDPMGCQSSEADSAVSPVQQQDVPRRHPLADIPTTLEPMNTNFPLLLPDHKGTAFGVQISGGVNFWGFSGQGQLAFMGHDDGPWYDRFGLVLSGGGGLMGGDTQWYEGLRKVDMVKGKVPGVGIGVTGGIIAVGNLGSLHDLNGSGYGVGGSVYAGVGGSADYFAPLPGTPDPFTGLDVGIGVGVGAEVHVQATKSLVLTPGSVLRAIFD
jgi:LysM repeat protein